MDRIHFQHAFAPPRSPRAQSEIHRPESCGLTHHLGPPLRDLPGGRGETDLWHYEAHQQLESCLGKREPLQRNGKRNQAYFLVARPDKISVYETRVAATGPRRLPPGAGDRSHHVQEIPHSFPPFSEPLCSVPVYSLPGRNVVVFVQRREVLARGEDLYCGADHIRRRELRSVI